MLEKVVFSGLRPHLISRDGARCFLNIYIADDYVGYGYGVDVFVLLCHFLLEAGFVRVFVQAFAYNALSLSALRGAGLPEADTNEKRQHRGREYRIHRYYVDQQHMSRIVRLLSALCRPKLDST